MIFTRRRLLQGFGSACALAGCGAAGGATTTSSSPDGGPADAAAPGEPLDSGPTAGGCAQPSDGEAPVYCLTRRLRVQARGAASLAPGMAVLVSVADDSGVIIGRDEGGLFSRSAVCTHACCVVTLCSDVDCTTLQPTPLPCAVPEPVMAQNALCPCHGSVFRLGDGVALTGPAVTPLPAYRVEVVGADVFVDTGVLVTPAERV